MLVLLVHSPLVGPSTWLPVAGLLRATGVPAVVPDLRPALEGERPFWPAVVELAASVDRPVGESVVVVAHSGAGAFLPLISERVDARALVFVDALLPRDDGDFAPSERFTTFLDELVETDGRLPAWSTWWGPDAMAELVPDPELRGDLEAEMPLVPRVFYDEAVPLPGGWTSHPAAYVLLSPAYREEADRAERHGWPVERLDLHHLSIVTSPDVVLTALNRCLRQIVDR